MVKALQINAERCKGAVQIFIVRFLLRILSGDGAAHDDGLPLPPWFCDGGVARPAHHMAWSPSPHFLLAGLHTSGAPRATYLGRDGPVDARHDHGVALWTLAQSRLLEHTSHRELVGPGSLGSLASTDQRWAVSVWRRESCGETRHAEPRRAERAYQSASSLVFWPPLRGVDGGVGRLAPPGGLSAHAAQAPRGLSP